MYVNNNGEHHYLEGDVATICYDLPALNMDGRKWLKENHHDAYDGFDFLSSKRNSQLATLNILSAQTVNRFHDSPSHEWQIYKGKRIIEEGKEVGGLSDVLFNTADKYSSEVEWFLVDNKRQKAYLIQDMDIESFSNMSAENQKLTIEKMNDGDAHYFITQSKNIDVIYNVNDVNIAINVAQDQSEMG
jgi:hypothetical protein